jgi:hypothetical protein
VSSTTNTIVQLYLISRHSLVERERLIVLEYYLTEANDTNDWFCWTLGHKSVTSQKSRQSIDNHFAAGQVTSQYRGVILELKSTIVLEIVLERRSCIESIGTRIHRSRGRLVEVVL